MGFKLYSFAVVKNRIIQKSLILKYNLNPYILFIIVLYNKSKLYYLVVMRQTNHHCSIRDPKHH